MTIAWELLRAVFSYLVWHYFVHPIFSFVRSFILFASCFWRSVRYKIQITLCVTPSYAVHIESRTQRSQTSRHTHKHSVYVLYDNTNKRIIPFRFVHSASNYSLVVDGFFFFPLRIELKFFQSFFHPPAILRHNNGICH